MKRLLSAICLYAMLLTNVMVLGVLSPPRAIAQTVQENLSNPGLVNTPSAKIDVPEEDSNSSSKKKGNDDDDDNNNGGSTPTTPLPCTPAAFTFAGTSPTSGSDGNTRTFTQNGVTARVNAFSIKKNNFNVDAAYLGLYPRGLGVTDRSEGNGNNNRFKTDNKGDYYNYVVFKLDRTVIFDRAYLNDVVTDSDVTLFIGTVPSSAPMTREEFIQFWRTPTVLENNDGGGSARFADFNAGNITGNLLIIGSKFDDSNDEFLINILDLKCPGGTQNRPPVAVNDSATVGEDSAPTIINVLANDSDPDGNPLTVTAITQPAGGVVTNNGTNVSFRPNANFNGTTSFTYTISDGQGGSATATVTVTVTPVNDAPDAVNDAATVAEDSSSNLISVLANDTDTDGNPLTVTAVTQPANGTVVNNGTNVRFTPNANFRGSTSFTYTISDGQGGSDTATVNVTVTNVNDAPDAVNDTATVPEDSSNNIISVLANDTDADGNTLTITAVTQPVNGSVVNNGTNVRFAPNANFSGTTSFTYTISDGQGGTDTATVAVTVTAVNDAPDAVNDSATIAEDSSNNVINVLANDTDAENNALTITAVTQGANGSVVNNGNNVSYTPNANFNGTDTFTYTISDGSGGTDTATVSVTVGAVNDTPDAVNDTATVSEDSPATILSVLSNDTDPDGNLLTITAVTQGANGTVVNNGNNVSYAPNANFNGTDTFTYTISDGQGGSDSATVTVTVLGVNDTPDAVDDSASVAEDSSSNAINVLANDTDADGNTLTITAVTQPANGSVTNNGTNASYTPNANFNGTDSFTYTISDGNGGSDTATVTVAVGSANDNPNAVDDAATVAENSSGNVINVLANDTDGDGDTLTVSAVTQGANGSVVNNGSSVSYTPNASFDGTDSFTYTISDGQGGTDTATVSITVTPAANPAGQLLLNEVEIDPPSTVSNACQYTEIRGQNAGGTVPVNTYFLSVNSDGANFGFANQAVNFGGQTVGANGTITLFNAASANCPNRVYDSGTTFFQYLSPLTTGTGSETYLVVQSTSTLFSGQDLDTNDDGLFDANLGITVLDGFALIVNPEEEFVYGADAGVSNISNTTSLDQPDAVTRFLENTTAFSASAFYFGELAASPDETTLYAAPLSSNFPAGGQLTPGAPNTLGVVANNPPDAVNDSATVAEDSSANIVDVLANDTDADGNPLTITAVTQGANGSVVNNGGNVGYTPNPNFFGTDTFTYTISDGNGGSDTATVSVTVGAVNDAPDAVDDARTVAEDSSANVVNVLTNDTDSDGGTLSVTAVTQGANGAVVNNGNNVSYTPNAGFSGSDSFTYTISDGQGGTDTATVSITVTPVNDAPDAVNDSATVSEDSSATILTVLSNDTDPDGDPLTITAVTQGANGSVINNGSNVSYTPNANFNGSDSFTYTISDGNGGTDTATVSVTVTPINDAPDAVNDSANVAEDSSANIINVLANDTDADGDTLTISAVTQGTSGSVANNGNNVSYTPNANFSGTDTFTYTISDGSGGTDTATVSITVSAVNDNPDAVDDLANVSEDSTNIAINVLANDTDVDGNTLTVSAVTQPANGSVVNNGTNVSYTPNANFNGGDTFTYTVSDGNSGTDTATVTVTVGGANDAPDAVNDSATISEDSSANVINVLANDTDGDGDTLTISAVTQGANGTVVNNGSNVSYTPNPNFFGTDSFTYTISDGNGGSDTATVTVTVTPVNDAPDAVNDAATVDENSTNNVINVLANDTDSDGGTLTITAVTQGANGSVVNNGTNVSYTPNANFDGTDSFTYTISDGNGGTDTATVSITVTPAANPAGQLLLNEVEIDPPSTVSNACQYTEIRGQNAGGTVPVNTYFLSVNSDGANFGFANQAVNFGGQTVGANGTITLFNNASLSCPGRVYDAGTTLVTYSSPLTIGTGSETYLVVQSTSTLFSGQDLDTNDDGLFDASLGITVLDGAALIVNPDEEYVYGAEVGVVNISNTISVDQPDAVTRFLENTTAFSASAFYFGELAASPDSTIQYAAPLSPNFPAGGQLTPGAPNTLGVVANNPPDAVNDSATVAEDSSANVINVLANDTDGDGNTLTITAVTQGANGSVVNNGSSVLYTPNANFFGTNSFTYTISDGNGGSDTATVNVTVSAVNDAPDAVNDSATVAEDSSANVINVLANDVDIDGNPLSITAATQGANGSVVNNGSNVSYTPNANFFGSDSFTYTVGDGNGGSDTATVSITVTAVNDNPDAVNDAATVDENSTNNVINVLANDTDSDGGMLSVTAITQGANGSVTFTAGNVSYTPNASFDGTDSFTYTISDGNGGTDTATVSVTVTPGSTPAGQLLLNEVEIDPPSTVSNACQYTEIRGQNAGGTVPVNTYFLSVNSDGANFGFANQAVNFGGQTVGANGTITLFNNGSLACPGRTYGAGTTFVSYFSPLTIGTGSETYLIVQSTTPLSSGQDLDTDDDGLFDANLGITVLDGFALIVNPEEEYVYGAEIGVVNISNTTALDQPDAVTRFLSDTTAFSASAFYFGELAASPDSTTQYAAPLSPNFPAGGQLTPGNPNVP